MKVGLTLPSFVDEPETLLAVAREADRTGVDGVFAYDHLFRVTSTGAVRPALECTVVLGAVAAETERVAIGTLVARATLRPAATLANALDTVHRIAGDRLLVTIGSGDSDSRTEMETFGFTFGTIEERVAALEACVTVVRGRGYPVWAGGSARFLSRACILADGWNRWAAPPEVFARELAALPPPPGFTASWGGLAVLGEDERAATDKAKRLGVPPGVLIGGPERMAEALGAYGNAGAEWVMLGPIDSSDPENAAIVGERLTPLLR
jgi:alkanesulfonate monooxygenase SsuD/methylene tetrahydromethanopterin reductase-like flavin-dependent oxidoreductase (luciferase family)